MAGWIAPLVLASLVCLSSALSWQRGSTVSISVAAGPGVPLSYNVSLSGRPWLVGKHVQVHCSGKWFSSADGSLVFTSSSQFSDWDAKLGLYDALDLLWVSFDLTLKFTTRFKFFTSPSVQNSQPLEFQQIFTSACPGSAVVQPPTAAGREFNSSSLSLSEFPIFSLAGPLSSLGYVTWLGRFSDDRSTHGVGLEQYQGGTEGGPLALFDPRNPGADSLVLSSADHFFSSMLNVRSNHNVDCVIRLPSLSSSEGEETAHASRVLPAAHHHQHAAQNHVKGYFASRSHDKHSPSTTTNTSANNKYNSMHTDDAYSNSAYQQFELVPGPGCQQSDCALEQNFDYEGNDLYSVTGVPAVGTCCALCAQEPACAFFSFVQTVCYLKYSNAGRISYSGHISGTVPSRALVFGVQGRVRTVTQDHAPSLLLTASPDGINSAMAAWGATLKSKYGTVKLADDLISTHLGYWTDNGGYYYGGQPLSASIATQLFAYINQTGVPIRYLQLDPFWYPAQCGPCGCGAINWTEDRSLFPTGLISLQPTLGVPLLLYSSMFCPITATDYPQYDFLTSNYFNVGWDEGVIAVPAPRSSFAFYNDIMSKYVDLGVMGGFEVDFMDFLLLLFDEFAQDLTSADIWATGIAAAALNNNMPTQFCMTLPAFIMASVQWPAVTNARASEDNFPSNEGRWKIAYTSLFYAALDIKPFMDVIWTTAMQPGNKYHLARANIRLQATIALLSAGPVGIGDGISYINATLARSFARSDGRLLGPGRSATPIDAMYGAQPPSGEVWQASTSLDGAVWAYVLSVDVTTAYTLDPATLFPHLTGQYVAFTSLLGPGCSDGSAASSCVVNVSSSQPLTLRTGPMVALEHAYSLHTLAPLSKAGWAVLGEVHALISFSPARFSSVTFLTNGVRVGLLGQPGEQVQIAFLTSTSTIAVVPATLGPDGTAVITQGQ